MNYYIHIPFCRSKCKYCHFASFSWMEDLLVERYLGFLKREIRDFFSNHPIGSEPDGKFSIYFWWWTPSILRIEELEGILSEFKLISSINGFQNQSCNWELDPEINSGWRKADICEITLEANPEFITREYVEWLKRIWVNRISMGVQTLNEESLEEIWRCKRATILSALDILEESGFENVALDFIIGLPYVKKWETKADIEMLLNRYKTIKHISAYMLEEWKYPQSWKELSLDEGELWWEYAEVADFLESIGFARYEISNFAKNGHECLHNSWYWNHTEYKGFWLSAASFLDNMRFANAQNFIGYYTGAIDYEEELEDEDLKLERLIFDWRTVWLPAKNIKNHEKLKEFKDDFLISEKDDNISVTNKWAAIADYIFKELFL
ncbi:MAG: Oxygen-independent coproporphyrinogen III oxidase [uncultured bacterium (gcode 4)]|uniref:Oxygen-independent coproporphyrinogen III oxidase n=1 Tax=uncultured bacterium (gcode 4) TaxID=1234023 RepID=K2FCW2_9BACT|nr:MAG: Oxygen-independent coproporphyrinogen III oxidase [uncultured bacterium (gcode 4)]